MNTTVISITPELHLSPFTIFDIGSNRDYLNQGAIDHHCRTQLLGQLEHLHQVLQQTTQHHTLVFSGRALDFLAEEQPQVLSLYKALLAQPHVAVATQPYHGTSCDALCEERFIEQVTRHQEALQTHFGTQASVLFTDKKVSSEQLARVGCSENLTHDYQYISRLHHFIQGQEAPYTLISSDLQGHLLDEFQTLSRYVHASGDELLAEQFHQLASPEVIAHAHPEHGESPYEHYTTLMSILQDVAHRLNAAKILKEGGFPSLDVQLAANPSDLLRN